MLEAPQEGLFPPQYYRRSLANLSHQRRLQTNLLPVSPGHQQIQKWRPTALAPFPRSRYKRQFLPATFSRSLASLSSTSPSCS